MFPAAVPFTQLPAQRSLKIVHDAMAEQERALFGRSQGVVDPDEFRRRASITSWSGDVLPVGLRIGEVPDPGVVLCLLYDVPSSDAPLPVDVFAQTLRRYALRDSVLRARFEAHVDEAGTYVPAWLSPEVRKQKSQEAFDAAMKIAREQGFSHAAPLFEGVRGDCFAPAQVAIAIYELRELRDVDSALGRLNEVVRVAPRNVAARMARAQILIADVGRKVEAAADYLCVLRELARPDTAESSREVREAAGMGLWALHREYAAPQELEDALAICQQDPERGFDAVSRYVHTHPCAWDAQIQLASLALARQRFDLTAKLLTGARWLFPEDPNPHFVYGQALASKGNLEAAILALEYAANLAPSDADIQKWLGFTRRKVAKEQDAGVRTVNVAHHVARSVLVLAGFIRDGHVYGAGTVLHKLPGDVSLSFLLHGALGHEQRRFSGVDSTRAPAPSSEDLRAVAARSVLMSYQGEVLSIEQTVGDIADPGVVIVLLYPGPPFRPTPLEGFHVLLAETQRDADLAGKLERHLRSPDASLKARLDLEG